MAVMRLTKHNRRREQRRPKESPYEKFERQKSKETQIRGSKIDNMLIST
jgi:hypothetical protein